MKKELLYIIAGILFFVLLTIMTEEYGELPFLLVVLLLAVVIIGAYLIDLFVINISSVADLETKLMVKLNEEGYQCYMEEDTFVYYVYGIRFSTYFWKIGNNAFKTKIVNHSVIDDCWDIISTKGKAVLAKYVNMKCYRTVFQVDVYGCSCSYTTLVKYPSDFISEIHSSYNIIGKTFDTAIEILPQIHRDYPANGQEGTIGFMNRERGM